MFATTTPADTKAAQYAAVEAAKAEVAHKAIVAFLCDRGKFGSLDDLWAACEVYATAQDTYLDIPLAAHEREVLGL